MKKEITPTENELKAIKTSSRFMLTCVLVMAIGFTFIFAAEYRPIVITYRTAAFATAYQPNTGRVTDVSVTVKVGCTSTLAGGQDGTISIQISPDNITYTTINSLECSSSVSLAIALTATASNQSPLVAKVPAGYYYKLVTTSTTGMPTFSIITQSQETSL